MSKVETGKRREMGGLEISPLELNCAACDSKFFDASGPRDNLTRINQLFLDSLSIEVPDSNDSILCLRFCPVCTLQLSDLDSLLTELENLQIRIQNVKDYICFVVSNAAFKSRNEPIRNSGEGSNALIVSIREQVIENWISVGRGDGDASGSGSRSKQTEDSGCKEDNSAARSDFECQGQNGLEIFDRIEQEESEEYEEEGAAGTDGYEDSNNSETNASYGAQVTDPPNGHHHGRAQSIKVEPEWGEVETTPTFSNMDQLCDDGAMHMDTQSASSATTPATMSNEDGDGQSTSNNATVYFQPVGTSNGIVFADPIAAVQKQSPTTSAAILQAFYPTTTFHVVNQTTTNGPSTMVKLPTNLTAVEIEMCTLCYKYVVSGVGHTCGEKSSTTMYQCGYCNAVMHSERALKDHVRRHISVENNKKSNRAYGCRHCKQVFPTPGKLSQHTKMEHGFNVQCKLCPKMFKDVSLFRIHMIAHSKNPKKGANSEKSSQAYQQLKKASFYGFVSGST